MSGIAGIYNRDGRLVERELLGRMTDAIAHRGPDGTRQWIDGAVGFGHQMLCTTPESLHETQPLQDASGQLCLVMDGRVDNCAELRAALRARGAQLRDDTDAELVLQSYMVWGEECPKHIIGDFAFAIWDARKQQLFCARDFLGIKPFYYYLDERTFRFGSELQQIISDTSIKRRPNEGMVAEYLANAITSQEETLYQYIMRLPPAHVLIVGQRQISKQRYWAPDFSKKIRYQTDDEYADHFLSLFKESIRCRMRSVGPTGITLSGGLDSSSIACVAASLLRESGEPISKIVALSEVYPGQECDESSYIQDVVEKWQLESYTQQRVEIDAQVYSEQVDRYFDFPGYPNTCDVDAACALAHAQNLRVLLSGVGGDEWFAGSTEYYADLLARRQFGLFAAQITNDIYTIGLSRTFSNILWHGLNPLIPHAVRNMMKQLLGRQQENQNWVNKFFSQKIYLQQRIKSAQSPSSTQNIAGQDILQFAYDGLHSLNYEIEDRGNAHLGFEQRHPFNDRRLVEFALALPNDQCYWLGWTKYILRIAMQLYLPESVQRRLDKAEFSIVFANILTQASMAKLFDSLAIAAVGWVEQRAVSNMYRQMISLYIHGDTEYKLFMWRLWRIAGIELWFNHIFLGRNALAAK